MGSIEHKQKIWNMISKIGTGMLVTREDRHLHARPMQLVQNEYEGTLWFFTQADSPKTDEIADENEVCVTFSDPDNKIFISLSGKARLTWDKNLINKLWNPVVDVWLPEGKEAHSTALLEIKVNHGEHWDSDISTPGYLFELAKSKITKTPPNLGENQKF